MNDMSSTLAGAGIALGGVVVGGLAVWFIQGALVHPAQTAAAPTNQFQDWHLTCPPKDEKQNPCAFSQDITDPKTNGPVARLVVTVDEGHKIMRIMVPNNVQLPPGLALMLGNDPPRVYPYMVCNFTNCFASAPMDDKLAAALETPQQANLVYLGLDQKPVSHPFSLRGFADAEHAFEDAQAKRTSWWRRLWS